MIKREIIEDIRHRVDIVDIVGENVKLKRTGAVYRGPCPFLDHIDTKPSFTIFPNKQTYRCYGCGRGGNVYTFLMEFRHFTFIDAVKWLADRVNVKLAYSESESDGIIDYIFDINEKACKFYQDYLQSNSDLHFFVERELDQTTINNFRLGYSGTDLIAEVQSKYKPEILDKCGLFIQEDFGWRNYFRNSYIFPLINMSGRVIGFGSANKNSDPKYINSPETPIYKKSEFLFGLCQAQRAIQKLGYAIVVEGYFDVLSAHRIGFDNTVGCCGTAFTDGHAKLLRRFTDQVVLMFDGDKAGERAVDTAFSALYSQGVNIFVVECPAGSDPDDLAKAGTFKDILKKARSWFDFRLKSKASLNGNGPKELQDMVNRVKGVANDITDSSCRELFYEQCALKIGIDKTLFYHKVIEYKKGIDVPLALKDYYGEALLVAAAVRDPEFFKSRILPDDIFSSSEMKILFNAVMNQGGNEPASLYNEIDSNLSWLLTNVLTIPESETKSAVVYESNLGRRRHNFLQTTALLIAEKEKNGENVSSLIVKLNQEINHA